MYNVFENMLPLLRCCGLIRRKEVGFVVVVVVVVGLLLWVFIVLATSAICCRPTVCKLTLVHPTQAVEMFGNISTAFGTLAIH